MHRRHHAQGPDRTAELMALEPAEVMDRYHAGRISRRDVNKLLGAIGLAAAAAPLLGREASAQEDLTMVIWAGYADESFAKKFEEENDAKINATPMASSDDAFARIQAGGGENFDLVSASNDVTERLIDAKLVKPIDPTRLSNYDDLYDQFKTPRTSTRTTNSTASTSPGARP